MIIASFPLGRRQEKLLAWPGAVIAKQTPPERELAETRRASPAPVPPAATALIVPASRPAARAASAASGAFSMRAPGTRAVHVQRTAWFVLASAAVATRLTPTTSATAVTSPAAVAM